MPKNQRSNRYELDRQGKVVKGDSALCADQNQFLISLFSRYGWTCTILSKKGSRRRLQLHHLNGIDRFIVVYSGNVRDESRDPYEKKIQLGADADPRNETPGTAVILGIYIFEAGDGVEDSVLVGFPIRADINYPTNPSLRGGVRVNDLLQKAKTRGFYLDRTNGNVSFRPEFIFYYLDNFQALHMGELVGVPQPFDDASEVSNRLQNELPVKSDPFAIAFRLFKAQRTAWKVKEGGDKTVYEDVNVGPREYFGNAANWNVGTLCGVEAFKDFCINHTWMMTNGKDSWKSLSEYSDEQRKKLVEWIDTHIVKQSVPTAQIVVKDNGFKGFTNKAVTELLMKFHPDQYCLCNRRTIEALEFLNMPVDLAPENYDYNGYMQVMGKCAEILKRLAAEKIYATAEGKDAPDYIVVNEFLCFVAQNMNLIKEKVMASVYKPTEIKTVEQKKIDNFADFIKQLEADVKSAGLKYAEGLMKRFVCAQLAKPFVVLTGLSGSGKTKLAEAFTRWIGVENTYRIVPVGADWTNNEKLLGYPNALDPENYVMPDTGVLKLMLDAKENPNLPFFLILDEMNLSHVERYFADFLSTMESNDGIIELYDSGKRYTEDGREIPPSFPFPKNLFVIGTMNVDETTYMFSPKVLDRAQVIEFRVSEKEIGDFLAAPANPKMDDLAGKGAPFAEAFLGLAKGRKEKTLEANEKDELQKLLIGAKKNASDKLDGLFTALADLGAEFGYRSAIEIVTFIAYYLEASGYTKLEGTPKKDCLKSAIDAAVLQKLLPKLHGSLNHLMPVLEAMIGKVSKAEAPVNDPEATPEVKPIYHLTYEKLKRMQTRLEKNGFTSFAEA